jgi:hypothetical protein
MSTTLFFACLGIYLMVARYSSQANALAAALTLVSVAFMVT